MSATASTLPKRKPAAKRKSRKKQSTGWLAWWPVILGIVVTPFAVKAATLMALTGPDGLRLLYPWMLIPKLHVLGLSDSLGNGISQAMMYVQFPLYGLIGHADPPLERRDDDDFVVGADPPVGGRIALCRRTSLACP